MPAGACVCSLVCSQVYKGRLRSTGEEVAVKVQRPGIGESIAMDMVLLRRLIALVDSNVPQVRRWRRRGGWLHAAALMWVCSSSWWRCCKAGGRCCCLAGLTLDHQPLTSLDRARLEKV